MLSQMRDCMEKYNLLWSPERRKYEIPFDIKEVTDYEFLDSIYVGKEKICSHKDPNIKVDLKKATELIQKNKFLKTYNPDLSNEIISLVKQTLQIGIVIKFPQLIIRQVE